MHTLLLSIHIVLMIISILVTVGSLIVTAWGHPVRTAIMRSNVIVTVSGLGSGAVLLLTTPLGVRCLMLTSYLIAFTIAYRFMARSQASLVRDSHL